VKTDHGYEIQPLVLLQRIGKLCQNEHGIVN